MKSWIITVANSLQESMAVSPDSTVSSLLASCSIDSDNSYTSSVIHYKDKLYSSASEALEAYIEDFDLSLTSSEISTGKICINQSTPKHAPFPKHRTKNRYVTSSTTVEEHGGRPGWGPRAERDPDSVSVTTDDLLTYPPDGSRPFVQRSPFKSRHQNYEWNRRSLKKSTSCPYQTSPFDTKKEFRLQDNDKSVLNQQLHGNFNKKKHSTCASHRYHSVSSKKNPRTFSFEENSSAFPGKNYPRWLTSGKSNLSVSGISSIPNSHYPIWLSSPNLFSDSANKSNGPTFKIRRETSSSPHSEILSKRHSTDKEDSDGFFEHRGCLDLTGDNGVAESCSSDSPDSCFQFGDSFLRRTKQPFREDQLELLLLKAEESLETSTDDLSNALKNDDSPSTTDILEAERSWENIPVAFKSPVPVCSEDEEDILQLSKAAIVHEFLEDCIKNKNKLSEKVGAESELCDREMIPVTNSLQKALHHLSRLKSLVEDTSNKQEQTDDHQEDEQKMSNL
ncbi:PREDICTED: lung adenoma susceptibility protein 2 [Tinamus guttatus]|uniref:lung adenoma susceptibility protein 2 n=1 Tax=Tinamus guttatus TaxID=94827 RepID=UPI00052EC757|nr:PREDICTED: lung adenoma susceptibility protein 2 [Tinamus guttatus]